jgi:fatty-acyl-CoA synthase
MSGTDALKASDLGRRGVDLGRRGVDLGRRGVDLGRRGVDLGRRGVDLGRRAAIESRAFGHAFRAGLIGFDRPSRALAVYGALDQLGQLGGAIAIAAIRHGDQLGLIDERGELTFAALEARSNALAVALRRRGLREGDGVGILCRNHRGFLDITFAAGKIGARILYLNTDFAGPQLRDVCEREGLSLLVHDEEYEELVAPIATRKGRLLAWTDSERPEDSLEALIAAHLGQEPAPPSESASVVLLTSGTTGMPKGAPRHQGMSLAPIGALLSKVPYRSRESLYVAAPMFHGLGFTQMVLAVSLGCTTVVRRRFKPERVLEAIAAHRPEALVVVPVMLQRIVSVLESEPGGSDTSSLRIVFCSGAQLEAELVRRAQRTIGDKLYNFYGSTEVAYATFATPEDLRAAPGTAGRVPFGAVVRLFDGNGHPVTGPNRPGRIFVGNGFQFEGYTGGGNKETIGQLMSTGDIGHFDEGGRLFVDGRDDDMIVSGGENLFPGEVEELLLTHPAIEEAAAIGVDDEEFGKRLAAFVVPRPGQSITEDEVRDFVKDNLARYKVPRDVAFLDELPRTPTGKVLKRRLRELHG